MSTYDDWKATDPRDAEDESLHPWEDDQVICSICKEYTQEQTAHWHQGEWIGDDCCWDERLRSSE